jgi:hypothetical protein
MRNVAYSSFFYVAYDVGIDADAREHYDTQDLDAVA